MTFESTQVSIIMPVKNAGKYLHKCLLSIREQTFTFWELIVVNDHSTDDSREILEQHALEDSRIQVLENKGQGITPALQLALDQSKGVFITRMDGDDLMPSERLKLMWEALSTSPIKTIVTGKVQYFSQTTVSPGYQEYESWLNERTASNDHWPWVYRECVIASPNWMVRRSDLIDIGGFAPLSYPEDYHLVLQWYSAGFKVQSLPDITLLWREHPERTSRNSEHYDQSHFFKLKVAHFLQHRLQHHSLVLWGAGPKGRLTADILDTHNQPFTWMDLTPDKYPDGIKGHSIMAFRQIESMANFKLLISVYPPEKEKVKLEKYLIGQGLVMGSDFWYL